MRSTNAVRVLRQGDVTPSRADQLHEALAIAASRARSYAENEARSNGQKQRYVALADSLVAQAASLRAEVA